MHRHYTSRAAERSTHRAVAARRLLEALLDHVRALVGRGVLAPLVEVARAGHAVRLRHQTWARGGHQRALLQAAARRRAASRAHRLVKVGQQSVWGQNGVGQQGVWGRVRVGSAKCCVQNSDQTQSNQGSHGEVSERHR